MLQTNAHGLFTLPSRIFFVSCDFQWNPLASLKAFSGNPLLKTTAKITLLYYTSVWAVVSTLMVYVARQFHFGPVKVRRHVKTGISQ